MQYMLSVIDEQNIKSDPMLNAGTSTPDEMAAISAFNVRMQADGHRLFAGGLGSPSEATVIDNRGEKAVLTDGPFLESNEFIAGIWIIEAPDLDVALKLAVEGSKSCNRKIEVRPIWPLLGGH